MLTTEIVILVKKLLAYNSTLLNIYYYYYYYYYYYSFEKIHILCHFIMPPTSIRTVATRMIMPNNMLC